MIVSSGAQEAVQSTSHSPPHHIPGSCIDPRKVTDRRHPRPVVPFYLARVNLAGYIMWDLVATAAAGLHAGAGLGCVLVEHPAGLDTGVGEYWALFPRSSTRGLTLSNVLSAISCGAALGAYFSVPEGERDPAWITAAIMAGVAIPYNLLILTPTKSVIDEPASLAKPLAERESWLKSWAWKKTGGVVVSGAAFVAMLLVLGTQRDEGKGVTGRRF